MLDETPDAAAGETSKADIAARDGLAQRYTLVLEGADRLVTRGSALEIAGRITNAGSASLDFRPRQSDPLVLGARAYPLPEEPMPLAVVTDRAPAVEVRGTVRTAVLRPGKSGRIALSIPTDDLPVGRYVAILDLVVEGRYWFADRGQVPVPVEFTCLPAVAPTPEPSARLTEGDGPRDAEFRYDLVLGALRDRGGEAGIVIVGTITNIGPNTLAFDTDGDDRVLVGAKVYAAQVGVGWPAIAETPMMIELRGTVDEPLLRTGESAHFEIKVPSSTLSPGTYLAVIDLVIENAFWFADLGQVPARLPFDVGVKRALPEGFAANLSRLVRAAVGAADDFRGSEDLSRLREVLARHELGSLDSVVACRDAPSASHWQDEGILDDLHPILAKFNAVAPGSPLPVSRFMLHLQAVSGHGRQWRLDTSDGLFRMIRWYLFEARIPNVPALPVPDALSDYLTADAYDPWLLPVTPDRLLLSEFAGESGPIALDDEAAFDALVWWWVSVFGPAHGLGAKLLSSRIVDRLVADDPLSEETGVPLSAFFAKLHATRDDYRARFDLASTVDRIGFGFAMLVSALGHPLWRAFVSEPMIRYFASEIDLAPGLLSRFEFLLAAGAGGIHPFGEEGLTFEAVRRWCAERACRRHPEFRRLLPHASAPARRPGLAIVHMSTMRPGLAMDFGMSIEAFGRLGAAAAIFDLDSGRWEQRPLPVSYPESAEFLRDVTLFHLGADTIPQAILAAHSRSVAQSYKVGYLSCALDAVPAEHRLALDLLDEIWAPSDFVRLTYQAASNLPVLTMGRALTLPSELPAIDWAAFGMAEGSFTFLVAVDGGPGLACENPLAAVRAFRAAFGGTEDVRLLVVRAPDDRDVPGGNPEGQWDRMLEIAADDARIAVIAEAFPLEAILALIQHADCVVSPHRSAGFGDLAVYGMALSRPVIATHYAGTMDFCTEATAYPVRWSPRPVGPDDIPFAPPGAIWAEIDSDHLAQRMREVWEQQASAAHRAALGAQRVRREYSADRLTARYRGRLLDLGILGG